MRFLIGAGVDPNPDSGAAGTVFQTNVALRGLGCEVDEIWKRDLGRRIQHGNLHYLIELPRAYRREVRRRCGTAQYDAVMLSQPHACLAGRWIRRRVPATLFLNRSHGWEEQVDRIMNAVDPATRGDGARRLARQTMRGLLHRHQLEVLRWADGMVVGCSPVADFLAEEYGYPRERIAVLPHGIPDDYHTTPLPPDDPGRWRRLLYVAQFAPFKAPGAVAEVFNALAVEMPDLEAGWVCDPVHHDAVRALLSPEARVRVRLYPWVSQADLIAIYDAHGLFLFPSQYEGFGKTPFEAMARGLAVISASVGGMADHIRSGDNGFLVEPGRAGPMIPIARRLLSHPDEARAIGLRARETACALTWERTARGLVEFSTRLAASRREGRVGP